MTCRRSRAPKWRKQQRLDCVHFFANIFFRFFLARQALRPRSRLQSASNLQFKRLGVWVLTLLSCGLILFCLPGACQGKAGSPCKRGNGSNCKSYANLYWQTQKNLDELEEMHRGYKRASANVKAKAMPVTNSKEVKVTLLAARASPASASRRAPSMMHFPIHIW